MIFANANQQLLDGNAILKKQKSLICWSNG